jgi:hypothetical protein
MPVARDGDILIAILNAGGLSRPSEIIRLDPNTGVQTSVSSGGYFSDTRGIAIESNGDILVADTDSFIGGGGFGAIIRVDPNTGEQTLVSSGPPFFDPIALAIVPASVGAVIPEPASWVVWLCIVSVLGLVSTCRR